MTTGLERIAVKARSDSKVQFTSLAHHLTPELLWECLHRIPNNSAAGIDGMSVKVAKESFNDWSTEVIDAAAIPDESLLWPHTLPT